MRLPHSSRMSKREILYVTSSTLRHAINNCRKIRRRSIVKIATCISFLAATIFILIVWLEREAKFKAITSLDLLSLDDKYSPQMLHMVPMRERAIASSVDSVFESGCRDIKDEIGKPREKAAMVVLARNSELDGVLSSMKSLERHFNQWFNYPWVFLNDEEFTEEFKVEVGKIASGKTEFGIIPERKWHMPFEKDDPVTFAEAVEEQGDRGIMYGSMPAYHRMCRFYSGYFFEHELVQKYDWYWRVEPDVDFYCDITYDPFREMKLHNKKYGFTIMIKELINTVPNLFRYTLSFARENEMEFTDSWPLFAKSFGRVKGTNEKDYKDIKDMKQFWSRLQQRVPILDAVDWSTDSSGDDLSEYGFRSLVSAGNSASTDRSKIDMFNNMEYSLCHFWSNFEISRTDLFLSPEYKKYFDFLEKSGGFYMERWGDAPIHSLATGLFLSQSEMHYFRDIGYRHSTLEHCPLNSPFQRSYRESKNYTHGYTQKEERYWRKYDAPVANSRVGTGCRCRCPTGYSDIENSGSTCIPLWALLSESKRHPRTKLDLNKIEHEAVQMYRAYVKKNPQKGGNWKLSENDRHKLEKYVLSG
ncbi:hypothetical protein HII13_002983 [Brettanomyces bruxellensis]|uniref:DEBR0S1_05182g1_1 n=1 Tax=Dekkera bruxellensis TaxID=5007 RepID=A0A7D9GWY2_DEKBR|nr:hypothetical protein HII13_002983 [Brettanomyces bruxellensis]VUG16006.1 KTR5 [Brettanomyces bruxellensis]